MKTRKAVLTALAVCTSGLVAATANAQVSPTGPFVGDSAESWETFTTGPNADGAACFGGNATIDGGGTLYVWSNSVNFGLCEPGTAGPVDGTQGMGLNSGPDAVGTISFDEPVCSFGGFWAAANGCGGAFDGIIEFSFLDAGGSVIGTGSLAWTDDDGDGTGDLVWAGWNSNTPIATVLYRGDYVVNDALQANFCEGEEEKCKGDGNGDGVVDVNDLLGLLAAWGPCPSSFNCEVGFICGGEIPWCTDDQSCACLTRADGTGIDCVFAGDLPCANSCTTDADCEPGKSCYIDTCCTDGVCGLPCPDGAAPMNIEVDPNAITAFGAANDINVKRSLTPAGNHQQVDSFNPDCPYDFNGDGVVDVNDLLSLLANWGPCPVVFEDCEVGFVCGDPLVICGEFEGFDCACFTHISGQPICVANSSCNNPPCPNGDADCPTGFLCTIDTCCGDNVCLEDCGGNNVGPCEVGFTCGDTLEICPPGGDPLCFCWTGWNGGTVCANDGACSTPCGSDGSCPDGMVCAIDTCCGEPICLVACDGGSPSQCDVGFTCGDEIVNCGEQGQCICFTGFDGAPVCAFDGSCGNPCGGDGSCPEGMVCVIDTCCTEPTCVQDCEGLNPGTGPELEPGTKSTTGIVGENDGALRASGN